LTNGSGPCGEQPEPLCVKDGLIFLAGVWLQPATSVRLSATKRRLSIVLGDELNKWVSRGTIDNQSITKITGTVLDQNGVLWNVNVGPFLQVRVMNGKLQTRVADKTLLNGEMRIEIHHEGDRKKIVSFTKEM
tara:strand:+ start:814 stop:1212 length:399 start_codon:yes stop_codon:yes gene_type:complete